MEWKNFSAPDFAAIKKNLKYPMIFHGRNLCDPMVAQCYGSALFGIERSHVPPDLGAGLRERSISKVAVKPRPRDVGAAAVYLCSDASRYVTAEVLVIEGDRMAR